jgi:hypothetical protein
MDYMGQFKFCEADPDFALTPILPSNIIPRPPADNDSPFAMISDDPDDVEAMKLAEQNANLVVLSDWDHLTSDAYMQAVMETGYDIL